MFVKVTLFWLARTLRRLVSGQQVAVAEPQTTNTELTFADAMLALSALLWELTMWSQGHCWPAGQWSSFSNRWPRETVPTEGNTSYNLIDAIVHCTRKWIFESKFSTQLVTWKVNVKRHSNFRINFEFPIRFVNLFHFCDAKVMGKFSPWFIKCTVDTDHRCIDLRITWKLT